MLSISDLLNIVKELNEEIENTIDGMSGIEPLYIETDGDRVNLKFGSPISWTNEDEFFDTKSDVEQALLHELKLHKIQVDGMVKMLERKNVRIFSRYPHHNSYLE